uniref:Uncharacterized protein n=1 Tax=Oryza brachyantha TaxID=4533 RepID=J3MSD1_ORYBR
MGNGETRNLACPYSTYPGKGRRDGVWTGNRGVTKASPASGSTKAQEGTARLGVKEGVKLEVRCDCLDVWYPIDVTYAFVAAVVSNFSRSSVKIEESSSTSSEESGIRYSKRHSQDEDKSFNSQALLLQSSQPFRAVDVTLASSFSRCLVLTPSQRRPFPKSSLKFLVGLSKASGTLL